MLTIYSCVVIVEDATSW